MNLPVIRELTALINKVQLGNDMNTNDHARCNFELLSDHIVLTELEIISPLTAITGTGRIFYENRLDLDFKVSLLEKLQNELNRLGEIGQIVGALSNTINVITYHVQGTLSEPKVTVNPIGSGK